MTPIDQLAAWLAKAGRAGEQPLPACGEIDRVIDSLRRQVRTAGDHRVPEEAQQRALRQFWQTQKLATLRDARLVAFGLGLPHGEPGSACLIEDKLRFDALLKAIDRWVDDPRRFRRCYQGLVHSYFSYDGQADTAPHFARENWQRLRAYLGDRVKRIIDRQVNPEWVKLATVNRHLFGESPCVPHAAALLRGESGGVDALCQGLGIARSSWFPRGLAWAQVQAAVELADAAFTAALPRLLAMLAKQPLLRVRGLVVLLNRHSKVEDAPLHAALRDAARLWLGHPDLPSDAPRWSGVNLEARARFAEWLRLDLIDTFFARFADDGADDKRRAAFWKRYVQAVTSIQVALPRPLPVLRDEALLQRKLEGLTLELHPTAGPSAALIMTVGPLVVVEFGRRGEAMHGYLAAQRLPFDLAQPLQVRTDAAQSLQSSQARLRLRHEDGTPAWKHWEDGFEAALRQQFDLHPDRGWAGTRGSFLDLSDSGEPAAASRPVTAAVPLDEPAPQRVAGLGEDVHWQTAEASLVPYSRGDLAIFARVHALRIDDRTRHGDGLWVRTGDADRSIGRVLTRWGFEYVAGQGWRR